MGLNVKPSSIMTLLDCLNPLSQAAATVTTGWIDMSAYESLLALVSLGVMGASGTVDAKLEQATSSGGAGVKDVPTSPITQLVKASNDNNQVMIECQDEQLDAANGFRWVRLSVTVGTAASLLAGYVFGFGARFQPAAQKATVVQVRQVRQ